MPKKEIRFESDRLIGYTLYDWYKFSDLTELHNKFPDIPIWMTEVCYVTRALFPPNGPEKSPVYEFSEY
jgi:hypothetical protein